MPASDFERGVLETAVDKLFNGTSHFSICQLEQIGDLLGVNVQNHPRYKFLRALHCVNYADMQPTVRDQLPAAVAEILRPTAVDAALFVRAVTTEGSDFACTEDRYLPDRAARGSVSLFHKKGNP